MVNSYRTLLADGSIQVSNRPQSANSRSRIDTNGCSQDMKCYGNNLYDGDILAAQEAASASSQKGLAMPQPPSSPSPGAAQKFQQQRAMAAQKRLERLQMNGLAQSNDGCIAIVSLNMGGGSTSSSRPGTPGARPPAGAGASCATAAAATGSGSWGQASPAALAQQQPRTNCSGGLLEQALPESGGEGMNGTCVMRPSSAAEKSLLAKGLATVYDPTRDGEGCEIQPGDATPRSGSSSRREMGGVPTSALDLSCMAAFLVAPGPRTQPVQCFIERDKGGLGRSPCYRMFLDDGRRFLLAARKRKKAAATTYIISSSADDISRHTSSYLGKLTSNFIGTEFRIVAAAAAGQKPGRQQQQQQQQQQQSQQLVVIASGRGTLMPASSSTGSSGVGGSGNEVRGYSDAAAGAGEPRKAEIGAILYQTNVLGTRGPRKMAVAVPAVAADGVTSLWRPNGPDDTILKRLRGGAPSANLVHLVNKTPRWNEALHAYCLNFRGRVTEASVKNFQLAADTDPDTVVLQFGKVSDTAFSVDYMWPLSPLQAFCACVSSLDDKLACE